MAKRTVKLTKSGILAMVEEKLQELVLLKSALMADPARKQEDLQNYLDRYEHIIEKKK